MDQNDSTLQKTSELEFHQGSSHRVPLFILLAWITLIAWGIYYFLKFGVPDFIKWTSPKG